MKRITLIILFFAVLALAVGCGAAQNAYRTEQSAPSAPPLPAEAYGTANDGIVDQRKVLPQMSAAQPTAAPAADSPEAQDADRMIVYTGSVSLEVNDTAETLTKIQDILKSVNGYISSKSVAAYGENKLRGTIQIRVPAVSLDSTLTQIRALGLKVLKEDQDSNDVTAEFTDLDARRKNLEAYEVELQKLLETVRERTGKAEDILAVYNQLTEVRGQIEEIKGRQNYLQNTSALATYTIELVPFEEVVVQGDPGWNPGQTARQALDNLVSALQGLGDFAIVFFLNILPLLLIVALPFAVLFFIVRAIVKRRTPKKPVGAN